MTNFTTWRSLIDGQGVAIPDSAIHHWQFNEGSGTTTEDDIGDATGTINGDVTWVENNWYGGYALDFGGVEGDDYIETTTLGDFGSNINTDFSFIFTIETNVDDVHRILSVTNENGNNRNLNALRFSSGGGFFEFGVMDNGGNEIRIETDTDDSFTDGGTYRVCHNKTGNDANDLEIWVNGNQIDEISIEANDGITDNTANFDQTVPIGAWRRDDGSIEQNTDGIIDNVVILNDSLSQSEIQNDYDAQPWS